MRPFSFILIVLLSISSSLLFSSCEKEYSIEGGLVSGIAGGTAVYTLGGDGGNCTPAQVNGTYTVNVNMEPSNNVVLQANVTAIGTYTINTGVVNGVEFIGSGNFTTTGSQSITLSASGIPQGTGDFPYLPPVGKGCAFFVTVN